MSLARNREYGGKLEEETSALKIETLKRPLPD